jgi:hypothetical protein
MRTRSVVLAAAFAALTLLAGCSESSDDSSQPKKTTTTAEVKSADGFCDEFEAFITDQSQSPESSDTLDDQSKEAFHQAAEGFADLAANAPDPVAADFTTFADALKEADETLAPVDSEDQDAQMAAAFTIMGIFATDDVAAASTAIEDYATDECGIDPALVSGSVLDSSMSDTDSGTSDGTDSSSSGEVSTDDISALADQTGDSWAQVTYSTMVSGGTDVVLDSADVGSGSVTINGVEQTMPPPVSFTQQEALDACDAIVGEFASQVPSLTVTVQHGDSVLATGDASGCTPAS